MPVFDQIVGLLTVHKMLVCHSFVKKLQNLLLFVDLFGDWHCSALIPVLCFLCYVISIFGPTETVLPVSDQIVGLLTVHKMLVRHSFGTKLQNLLLFVDLFGDAVLWFLSFVSFVMLSVYLPLQRPYCLFLIRLLGTWQFTRCWSVTALERNCKIYCSLSIFLGIDIAVLWFLYFVSFVLQFY